MNLHIAPDNVFINKFHQNLEEIGIAEQNRIVVRTNYNTLRSLKHPLPFGKLYTRGFEALTGSTDAYARVFVHFFSPLLYRWVAAHSFRELNWMVWGADLYNLPSVDIQLYERLTFNQYVRRSFSWNDLLYRAKVRLIHQPYGEQAYGKVRNVLTWMDAEYAFARQHLPALKAEHRFFFYENDLPYQALDEVLREKPASPGRRPRYILGNSATAELNHLDAVAQMEEAGVTADLVIPVSYGDKRYAGFLRKHLDRFRGGEVRFLDHYMPFGEYIAFLNSCDGLIMNNIRPQGYGNIFMMMYLGKKIFLNPANLSLTDLDGAKLRWLPLSRMGSHESLDWESNKQAVTRLLSHERLLNVYRELFS